MKPSSLISLACATLLTLAVIAPGLASENAPGAQALLRISSSDEAANEADFWPAGFRLLGIALSNIPGKTLAIIETGPERRQKFIREGGTIGAMSIKKILKDRVVFASGQSERIARLNGGYLVNAFDSATPTSRQPISVQLPSTSNEKTIELEGGKLSAAIGSINDLVRQVNISPISFYGEPIGIRISPITPGSIFEELGLETGDIIEAVNGQEIRKQEEAIAFLDRIRDGGEFDINVRGSRRDKQIQLIVK